MTKTRLSTILSTNNISPPVQGQPIKLSGQIIDSIEFYTGCRPVSITHEATGNLLRVCRKSSNGDFVSKGTSVCGFCGYFRLIDFNGKSIFDGTVGVCGTDIVISTGVEVVAGGILTVLTADFFKSL